MTRISGLLALLLLVSPQAFSALKPGDFVTSGPATGKRIALTFDDGPGPHSQAYLDLLDRYGVKATFFMLAEQVTYKPKVAKEIAAKGHEVASHTFDHTNYLKRYHANAKKYPDIPEGAAKAAAETQRELTADMKKSREIIEKATGAKLVLLRMPHGIDRPFVKAAARETGFVLANWTFGGDWLTGSEETLTKEYTRAIKPGAVILLHDGGSKREKSLRLTEAVLKAAKEQGYEIVVLSELLGLKN